MVEDIKVAGDKVRQRVVDGSKETVNTGVSCMQWGLTKVLTQGGKRRGEDTMSFNATQTAQSAKEDTKDEGGQWVGAGTMGSMPGRTDAGGQARGQETGAGRQGGHRGRRRAWVCGGRGGRLPQRASRAQMWLEGIGSKER